MTRFFRYATLVLAGLALVSGSAGVRAQDQCTVARLHPLGILEQCGDELRSRLLEMSDIRRFLTFERSGVFYFACPVDGLCGDDPQISGWLVNGQRWQPTAQDEETILGIFRNVPSAPGFARNNPLSIDQAASRCGLFDVTLAGLSGRGVCYRSSDETSSAVVVVVSDARLGYILIFHQQDVDAAALKEKVLTLLPRFRIQTAKGDFGLAVWLR